MCFLKINKLSLIWKRVLKKFILSPLINHHTILIKLIHINFCFFFQISSKMFSCCCPCKFSSFKKGEDDSQDPFQRQYSSRKADSNLDDALKRNFTSIRGRKDRIRNIKINVLPTPFDNDSSSTNRFLINFAVKIYILCYTSASQ